MRQQLIAGLTFFSVFTSVYLIMHWPVYYATVKTFFRKRKGRWPLRIFFAAMILGPGLTNLSGYQSGPLAQVVFTWMGLLFYLFLGSLPLLLVRIFAGPKALRIGFVLLLAVSLGITAYGWVNARRVVVRQVNLETTKLPEGLKKLDIAVISDLHLNSVDLEGRLDRTLEALGSIRYDLLISLGDLIEVGLDKQNWPPLADRLAELRPRLGKYAVMGNHEYYTARYGSSGFAQKFHQKAGFTLLRQEAEVVAGVVQLVGLDDRHFGISPGKARSIELNLLQQLSPDLYTILLKHRPEVSQTSLGLFDLQLAGHTHGGQIWPFKYVVGLIFDYLGGLYDLGSGSRLYVVQGTGTWGPPLRVGTKAELTLIRLSRNE